MIKVLKVHNTLAKKTAINSLIIFYLAIFLIHCNLEFFEGFLWVRGYAIKNKIISCSSNTSKFKVLI